MTFFLPQEVIRKKRDGHQLTARDLEQFLGGFLAGEVADYQVSALLMTIFYKGMITEEIADLTSYMKSSGRVLAWPGERLSIVDKHSTGGVGDKTSLVVLPLCVLEGARVPMMSGRGLGHTGGTLDKLESIPGMKVQIGVDRARRVLDQCGGVFMGQTDDLCPLDKRLYALRDVTSTIESVPLITASILSKKLAEGIGALVMDVKTGSGAFMQSLENARELSQSLFRVGRTCGLKITCMITDMDSPLGETAGNALEVFECMDVMQGKGPASTRQLCLELATEMIALSSPTRSHSEIWKTLDGHLNSGKAWEKFVQICVAQGADANAFTRREALTKTKLSADVVASQSGRVGRIDTRNLGIATLMLGGGRRLVSDPIDPAVGLSQLRRVGDSVGKGQVLARLHANDADRLEEARRLVESSYVVTTEANPAREIIIERLKG